MAIKTKEFTFPRTLYFAILVQDTVRRSWWAAMFLVGISVFESTQKNSLGFLWLLFPAAYFIYVLIRCWMHVGSKVNPYFFAERYCEIDDRALLFKFTQGRIDKIGIDSIMRVVKNRQYYRLFINKKQFIYMPVNVFRTKGDMQRFDELLKARKRPQPGKRLVK